jgi:hypothetical protein
MNVDNILGSMLNKYTGAGMVWHAIKRGAFFALLALVIGGVLMYANAFSLFGWVFLTSNQVHNLLFLTGLVFIFTATVVYFMIRHQAKMIIQAAPMQG